MPACLNHVYLQLAIGFLCATLYLANTISSNIHLWEHNHLPYTSNMRFICDWYLDQCCTPWLVAVNMWTDFKRILREFFPSSLISGFTFSLIGGYEGRPLTLKHHMAKYFGWWDAMGWCKIDTACCIIERITWSVPLWSTCLWKSRSGYVSTGWRLMGPSTN